MWIINRIRIVGPVDGGRAVFYDVGVDGLRALHEMGAPPAPLPACAGLELELDWRWIKPPLWRRILSYFRRER
jgi:hypothetical protein